MTDFYALIRDTGAYKTIAGDKASNKLSHAYLVLSADGYIKQYLKVLAQLIACDSSPACGLCRTCRLIAEENYLDVVFYPQKDGAVLSEDVVDLIEKSYLSPVEGDKKIFIISKAESMTAAAQNKLLKTLEEPPAGVHIIIGAASEYPLLATLRSRTKTVRIPPFTAAQLTAALGAELTDAERLAAAVSCGDGTAFRTVELYNDRSLNDVNDLAESVLTQMRSSKDVLNFSVKISALGVEQEEFFSVLEAKIRDGLAVKLKKPQLTMLGGQEYAGFNEASYIYALEKINQARERKKFNGGGTMLTEWLLFAILEGKHKWQKY